MYYYCGLKGVFLCGNVPLQTVCAPYLWWRAGFDVDSGHIFPHGVLAVITLEGSVAGDKGAKACTECRETSHLFSVHHLGTLLPRC